MLFLWNLYEFVVIILTNQLELILILCMMIRSCYGLNIFIFTSLIR